MEQLVDSPPVVPSVDAPVPLMAEQLVDVLSLVAKYEKEMDRIEDLVLVPLSVLLTGRLGVAGSTTPPLPPVQRGRRRRREEAVLRRARGVRDAGNCGYSAVAVHRQAGGRACCCATTRLEERSWCASATDHGRCGGDSACACLRGADCGVPVPHIMEVLVVPQITEEIVEVLQPGTRLSTCSLLCNNKCLGRQSRKLWRFHSCSFLGVVQFLDKVVDTPAGVQRQARGPDSAENHGVSAVAALGRVCPGSSAVFEPSMMKSSTSSRAPWGWR